MHHLLWLVLIPYVFAQNISVRVQSATVVGITNTTTNVDSFRGVKYGTARRFERAVLRSYANPETINATFFGPACPQIKGIGSLAADYTIYGVQEDCTILDIYRPTNVPKEQLLPVMVWLHGGALTQGAASYYPGDGIASRSAEIGLPVIAVILNYRLGPLGFLGGAEAAAGGALNLGLYDQKLALEWIQQHIRFFGGDPAKVTVFGQSAGAMTLGHLMLDVNTKLLRGAILQSGTTTSVPAIPPVSYQSNYDAFLGFTGCSGVPDSLQCLKTVDLETILKAANTMFGNFTLYGTRPWGISIDGDIIPDYPSILTAQGKIAKIPFIAGTVLDEGTVFVKPKALNTTAEVMAFLQYDFLNRNASFFQNETSISALQSIYPDDPALGAPYGTKNATFFGPQFKRAASMYGDIHFDSARRFFLDVAASRDVKSWSFIFDQVTPGTAEWQGVFHRADVPYVFQQITPDQGESLVQLARQMLGYWVSFAHNLDPNLPGSPTWELYRQNPSSADPGRNMVFKAESTSMQWDIYRTVGISYILSIYDQFLQPLSRAT